MGSILEGEIKNDRATADHSLNRHWHRVAILLVLVLTVSALFIFAQQAYGTRAGTASHPVPSAATSGPASSGSTKQGASVTRIRTEIINILPDGFEPAQITRAQGQIFLIVENHSGLAEVSVQLNSQAGSRLRDAQLSREKLAWSDLMDLAPGKYLMIEASHPDWTCEITITPK